MRRQAQRCLLFAAVAACASCTGWPTHPQDTLKIDVPQTWREAGRGEQASISTGWLSTFNSPRMTSVVREAVASNRDLQATAARLRATKEATIVSHSRRIPSANLGSRASRSRLENGDAANSGFSSYGLTFRASWELDLWGRLRDLDHATFADYEAALASFRSARLSLAANTAKSWCNLIAANQQLDLATVTLDSFKKNLRVIERNYKAGVPGVRSLDVNFGRTNVAAAERTVRQRQLDRDNSARALEVLLGRYPAAELSTGSDLPKMQRQVPAGIPANTLERRPDLASARARLLASARRADAARKNLLPSVSLTGSSGTGGASLTRLLDPNFLVSSIAASLEQLLFDGGATAAEARAVLARNEAAIHDYAQLALEALQEVESSLAADRSLAEQEGFLVQEVAQAELAEGQSQRDYSEGIEGADILDVLEAQRRANNARLSLIRLRNNRLQNRFDLHLALGGSF